MPDTNTLIYKRVENLKLPERNQLLDIRKCYQSIRVTHRKYEEVIPVASSKKKKQGLSINIDEQLCIFGKVKTKPTHTKWLLEYG